jgi:hypothetical protein
MGLNQLAQIVEGQATSGLSISSAYHQVFGGETSGAHLSEAEFWLLVDILSTPAFRQVNGLNGTILKEAA